MIGEFLTAMFSIRWNGKYFNEWNFYLDILRIQENWVSRKFHNELACVFTAYYNASKNTDWNQQQLTDGGVLANRNSANHPNCFLSNQKKVQILAFLHVICKRNVSCPPPENRLQRLRERAWSQATQHHSLSFHTSSLYAVRVKGGMSLRNGMWHGLRNDIIMRNVKYGNGAKK